MICFRNARVIDTDCGDCKSDGEVFKHWRQAGGRYPEPICKIDHRYTCMACDNKSDSLKHCTKCGEKF